MIIYSQDIRHFGVLGMRWGIRRYQNPDGSLTKAGEKRNQKLVDLANKKTSKLERQALKYKAALGIKDTDPADVKDMKDFDRLTSLYRIRMENQTYLLPKEVQDSAQALIKDNMNKLYYEYMGKTRR